jgi:hypothetical protein
MVDEDFDALTRLSTELERVRASSPGGVSGTSLLPRGVYETGTDLFTMADAPSEFQTDSIICFRVSSGEGWAGTALAGFVMVQTWDGSAAGIRQLFFPDAQSTFYSRSSTDASTWGSWSRFGAQADAVADISSTITTDNMGGTADGTLDDIGDTTASNQAGVIEGNFREVLAEITALQSKVNNILSKLRDAGLMAT